MNVLEKKESKKKVKSCYKLLYRMNKSPQYVLQGEPEQCKSEVWEMYLPKGITWTSISEIIVAILENLSEETKSDRAPSRSPNWLQIGLMYGQYPTSNTIQS